MTCGAEGDGRRHGEEDVLGERASCEDLKSHMSQSKTSASTLRSKSYHLDAAGKGEGSCDLEHPGRVGAARHQKSARVGGFTFK